MKPVRFHPWAELEILEAQLYYRDRSDVAAQAFALEMDHAFAAIAESPERWLKVSGEVRRYVLRRFPYNVLYRFESDRVFVTAIAHQSRRPGYWYGRWLARSKAMQTDSPSGRR